MIDGVSIITCTIRQHYIDNVFENYARQTYKNKELIIILNKNDMKIEQWKKKAQMYQNVKLFKLDESISLGTCLNYAIEKAKFDYITKFDDDNYYAPRFIDDLMKVFLTTKADIVGKLSYFVYFEGSKILAIHSPGKENKYVNFLSGSAMIIRKEVFNNIKFPDKNVGEDTEFLLNCVNSGFKLYSSDKFNYVCIRRPSNKDHTWKIKEYTLLKNCKIVARTNDYKRYVTV
ncbi:hypothetical protein TR13x_03165 [Caloranaerobacter sp. TR13]|nr:hypothetical protein TR13x_03165 [Caloranaerobacter sp. TR13]